MEIFELVQAPKVCSYLPDCEATFRYFYIQGCTPSFYYKLLDRVGEDLGIIFLFPFAKNVMLVLLFVKIVNLLYFLNHKKEF